MTKPLRVLLIEDDPGDVVLIRQALRDASSGEFEVESTSRLEDGLSRLREQHIDIVLLNLTLPDSSGIEALQRLHSQSDVPIVVVSGDTNDAVALTAVEQGAQDYLVKGAVSGELLVRILRYSITRHRLARELEESEQQARDLLGRLKGRD